MERDNIGTPEKLHDPARRFDRFGRLVGDEGLERLRKAHVVVIGLGGVGSWAAEAVMRSGIGHLSVVDFDRVCIMNFNRQLPALHGLIGQPKAEILAARFRQINPAAKVTAHVKFFSSETVSEIFSEPPSFVIDAIDHVTSKCFLLNYCHSQKIPMITSTGSGGRWDPTQVRVRDLADTEMDPLARVIRKILRQQYGFPSSGKFGIKAVFSAEAAVKPKKLAYDEDGENRCRCSQGDNGFQNCDKRNLVMGTASFVTGAFGMACASQAIQGILEPLRTGTTAGQT